MAERAVAPIMDSGTRQWDPVEQLDTVRMGLHQQLASQRASRAAASLLVGSDASTAPALASTPAQISLSYAELLQIVHQAAVDQRGVTLTRSADQVHVKAAEQGALSVTGPDVGQLIEMELALRDCLEQIVARRYLAMRGVDHVLEETAAESSEALQRMGM